MSFSHEILVGLFQKEDGHVRYERESNGGPWSPVFEKFISEKDLILAISKCNSIENNVSGMLVNKFLVGGVLRVERHRVPPGLVCVINMLVGDFNYEVLDLQTGILISAKDLDKWINPGAKGSPSP